MGPSPGLYSTPSLNLQAPSPRNTQGFGMRDVVDEEAELEMGYNGAGYGASQGQSQGMYGAQGGYAAQGQGLGQQGGAGYSMFPASSPSQGQQQQQRPGQQVAPPPNAGASSSQQQQQQGRSRRLSLEFKGPEGSSS